MSKTVTPRNPYVEELHPTDNTLQIERLLTIDELAARLKVKKSWVYARIHAKNLPIPVIRVGHYVRFNAADVEKFIRVGGAA
jgi:excisionase family DNA binding protein